MSLARMLASSIVPAGTLLSAVSACNSVKSSYGRTIKAPPDEVSSAYRHYLLYAIRHETVT
jgi:hypothetical protein